MQRYSLDIKIAPYAAIYVVYKNQFNYIHISNNEKTMCTMCDCSLESQYVRLCKGNQLQETILESFVAGHLPFL